jgi:hypothetical protein
MFSSFKQDLLSQDSLCKAGRFQKLRISDAASIIDNATKPRILM